VLVVKGEWVRLDLEKSRLDKEIRDTQKALSVIASRLVALQKERDEVSVKESRYIANKLALLDSVDPVVPLSLEDIAAS
jgi:hypothetical protein